MRVNFQRLSQDRDLADEFLELCLLKARYNGECTSMQIAAKEMFEAKRGSRLLFAAAGVNNWSDAGSAWFRLSGLRRQAFDDAVRKATVPVGTTADAVYAEPLVALTTLMGAFFRSLVNRSLTDAVLAECVPVPPNTKFAVTTGVGSGNSAQEAQWTPLTSMTFEGDQTLPSKALGLFVVSEDLLRMGGELADNFLKMEMSRAIVLAADIVSLGILTNGITPTASSGAPRADLRKALESIDLAQWSKPMVFVSPDMIAQMATLGESATNHNGPPTFPDLQLPNGGTISGMPTMGIDALSGYTGLGSPTGDFMVVVDAAQVAGSGGAMDLLASNDASILMADAGLVSPPDFPVPGSPYDEPTAAQLVSMFQTNSVAFRGTRYFNLSRARDTAVAVIGPCNYGL